MKVKALPRPSSLATGGTRRGVRRSGANGEAQSRSLLQMGRANLLELLEDPLQVSRRDADAVVTDADHRSSLSHGGHDDMTTFRRELQRIGQEVEQYLFDLPLVRVNHSDPRVDIERQGELWRVARSRSSATEFCTRSESTTGVGCRSIRPASIFERSRMSLISVSR